METEMELDIWYYNILLSFAQNASLHQLLFFLDYKISIEYC